jgi:hypothetical protein
LSTFPGVPHGVDKTRSSVRGESDFRREIIGREDLGRDRNRGVLSIVSAWSAVCADRMWRGWNKRYRAETQVTERKDL